ncbi:putative RNA-dependent RNA polymerase 3 isoform X2 [Carex rostrata]
MVPPPPPFSGTFPISPTSRHRHVSLPELVENMIARICAEKSATPPDHLARQVLDRLGESESLKILGVIALNPTVRNFSAFIMHKAKNSPIAMAHNAEGLSTRQSDCLSGPLDRDDLDTSSAGWEKVERESILSDQEMITPGRIVNSPPTVVSKQLSHFGANSMGNDNMVRRRLDMEMDQARLQNYDNHCHSSIPQRVRHSCQRVISPQMKFLGDFEFRKRFLILSYLGRVKLEETVSMELLSNLTYMTMEAFEFQIWKEFGMKNIKPSDRRKILDWDMDKTHVYHCYVDLQGKATFKGPFLESTKTHLQRVLGDENVLQVNFEEVSQEKKTHDDFDNYYCDVYHRVAEQGIELGMRQYQFLMYKDGGKEEKKKSGTKSSVKCYFVCTSSSWDRDQNNDFHYGKTVNEIRHSFMHIHNVPSLAKYISRLSLVLSKTLKLDIDLSDPELKVETIPDIPCKDGSTELEGIHTDGTGFISEDLALQCPIYVSKGNIQAGRDGLSPASAKRQKIYDNDGPPLLMQVRLFYNGLCAKGTLLVNRLLPKKTIQVRPSMIKVKPDPSMCGIVQPFNSLEVVNTSTRPKKVHLSRYLISLLHYGGVPAEFFLGLLSTALAEAEYSRYDRGSALKVALNNEGLDNDHLMIRMITKGIPLDEPFLQYRLGFMMGEERKRFQEGKIPISDSYYLMGTTDPTGKLRANQVCIILDKGQLSGNVLVYKHPGMHPGDIHLLQATFVEGLERVVGDSKFAIFFPAVGPRSLADEMANSDFDGDMYWVSRHPELLKHFKPNPPWVAPEEDSSKNGAENISPANMNDHELERLLFRSFLNSRFKPSNAVGLAADCWLVYMDRLLTAGVEREEVWPKIEKLINISYDALDASKTGKKVEVGKDLKVVNYPHFMEKEFAKDEYNSSSILGLIYDKVQSFKAEKLQSTKFEVLPCLSGEVPKYCMDKWRGLYQEYLMEMTEALQIPEKGMKNNKCQEIIDCYKKILYGAGEYKERTRHKDEIKNEALAIYQIVYEKAKTDGVQKCGFAWKVAGSVLIKYYTSSQPDYMCCMSLNVLHEICGVKF